MSTTDNEYHQKISVLEQQLHHLKQQQHTQEDKKTDNDMMERIVCFLVDKLSAKEDLLMRLPIYKIDDIRVDVFLKSFQHQKTTICLFIEDVIPEHCVGYHEYLRKHFQVKNINREEVRAVVQEIQTTLNHLKFSKLYGTFSECEKHDDTLLIWKSLIVADNIQWSVNECAVCLDETLSKTICGHHLCRGCFQKLKRSKCPMCRQSFTFDDDSDDDSDDEDDSDEEEE